MKPHTMTTRTLRHFITDLDFCDRDEVIALWQHAKGQAGDFCVSPGLRPMWADLAKLLKNEIKRY
jgi:hypothetical protein